MKEADARKLAAEIAKDLFTNGHGDRAERLVHMGADGSHGEGWSEEAVIARLTRWIQAPLKVKQP